MRPEICVKGTFFGAVRVTQNTQLVCLNGKNVKQGIFFTKILNKKGISQSVIKKGV